MPSLILLLRRDVADLTAEEKTAIQECYPDGVEYRRIDPANYLEHDEICKTFHPVAVLLPRERPIPSLAMEHGYRHITYTPQGLLELLPLQPKFEPFRP